MGKFSIREELNTCSNERKNILLSRINDIAQLQEKNGMTSRDDSLLTWKHVNRFSTPSPHDVAIAKELVAVDYIHKNTEYSKLIEEVMRLVAFDLVSKDNFQWGDAYKLTRKYIPDMIKLYCLHREQKQIKEFCM